MKKFRRIATLVMLVSLFAGIFTFTSCAKKQAAKYPSKSITYIICFNPGGESDITARIQQDALKKALGVPIVISYKAGGGGAAGWSELVKDKPDGYTIYGTNLPHIIVQPLTRDAGYKTEQIDNIYIFEFTPCALMVRKDSPIKNLEDFINYAKEHPGMTIGGTGKPSGNSLATTELEQLTGLKLTYVPFSGTGATMPALFGGHVTAVMGSTSAAVQYADKVRTLAVGSEKRLKMLPDVPTFRELGYDLVEGIYRGVAVPPGTPENIKRVLEQAFDEVNHDPEVVNKMENMGFLMTYYKEEDAKKLIDKLTPYYKKLLEAAQ